MPRIPTRSSPTQSPSGRIGETPLPVSIARTGGQYEAQGYRALGAGIGSIAQTLGQINLMFAQEDVNNEVSQRTRSMTEFMDRRLTEISQMTDTTAMLQRWDETAKAIEENFKGTSDAANDDILRIANARITQGAVQVNNMWRNQVVRNTDTETRNMMDQAIQKNLPDQYEDALQRRARIGLDTPAEQDSLKQSFPVNVYLANKMREMETDPEATALELSQVGDTITQNGQTVELTMDQKKAILALEEAAKRKQYAMEAQANYERIQRANAFDREYTDTLLSGDVSAEMIDKLIANPDLTPARKTSLYNATKSLMDEMSKPREYTDDEKLQAYVDVLSVTDPAERELEAIKRAPIMGFTTARGIVDDIRKPTAATATKSLAIKSIDKTILNMRSIQLAAIKSAYKTDSKTASQEAAKMNSSLLRLQAAAYREVEEHPERTPEQQAAAIESILAPAQEEVAQKIVENTRWKWIWPWKFPGEPMKVEAKGFGGGYRKAEKKQPTAEELRAQNTREAYEQGKTLGYWQ